KDSCGKIEGVEAIDLVTGEKYMIKSRLVINCTGVFADEIIHMDTPEAKRMIKPSQGVHLVFDRSFLNGKSALMIPKTDDGRVLFAIPWYDKTVAGTTDTPLNNISREPVPLTGEIDFILNTAGRYMVRPPTREDILSVFAGLRPLASDPDNPHATKEISRRHKIILSGSDLLTITGGKWTTYRCMAEEAVDCAIKAGLLQKRKCVTKNLKIESVSGNLPSERLKVYGENAHEIGEIMKEKPELAEKISEKLPYTKAEIIWICSNEMPVTLEDMLSRRLRALILDAAEAAKCAPLVAEIMAGEMGYDGRWIEEQVACFRKMAGNYLPST
ncbi:MAG: FAD-dependent oxidoreductase, partial [Bacteroidales bacterium]|nr:FAD-dependent oxidoreductase [Bacteroidales bacterium]